MNRSLQPTHPNLKGGAAALVILSAWAGLLMTMLATDLTNLSWWWAPFAVLVQTFLYTGLFITAHDAMHRTVTPDYPRLNRAVGRLAVTLYALFSFRKLEAAHWEHHRHPASNDDPDFHDEGHAHPVRWYFDFMKTYLSAGQLVGMVVVFNVLQYLVGVSPLNLIVFWVVPALASTVQLFYFGTVLPHRRPEDGYDDHHRTTTNDFSPPVSFLTCYHFGYHWEHHERPDLPWWALPRFRRRRIANEEQR